MIDKFQLVEVIMVRIATVRDAGQSKEHFLDFSLVI